MKTARLAVATACILGLFASTADAATINVDLTADNVTDDQQCTLREAVQSANLNQAINASGGEDCEIGQQGATDTIQVPAGTYNLTGASGENINASGDLDLQLQVSFQSGGPVVIAGAGSGSTQVNAAAGDRVLDLASVGTATIQDITLAGGSGQATGGGVNNGAAGAMNLTLDGARVTGNSVTQHGAGISWGGTGTLNVLDSRIDSNTVSSPTVGQMGGGGIWTQGANTVNLTGSTIASNTASVTGGGTGTAGGGGGVAARNGATVHVLRSAVDSNTASATNGANTLDFLEGGGINLEEANGTIIESTVAQNSVSGGSTFRTGGGISFGDTATNGPANNTLDIENTTISTNTVQTNANATGGGLRVGGGSISIVATTFTGNTAGPNGGDGYYGTSVATQTAAGATSKLTIYEEGAEGCRSPSSFLPVSQGYNNDQGTSCGLNGATDNQSTSSNLGALAANGGVGRTHALNAGSPAINDVPVASCTKDDGSPLATDQRGVPRPQGANCDIGAYERAADCLGQPATVVGTGSGETLNGTDNADVILALGGADTIVAGDGLDRVCGGDGDDVILGGTGNDNDILAGEANTDTLSFADNTTAVTASLGTSSVSGTDSGADVITGFESLEGGAGNDTLTGDANPNTIGGNDGNDTIQGLGGADAMDGGANVAVNLPGTEGDRVSYLSSSNDINASLADGTATGEGADTLNGFEALVGGTGNDTLAGDSGPNFISGFTAVTTPFTNVLDGRGGNDYLQGTNSPTIDTVTYANLPGPVTANLATNGSTGAQGNDTYLGGNIDNLVGSPDGDTLTGNGSANTLSGIGGADTLADGVTTTAFPDVFNGGDGSDSVSYAARNAANDNIEVDLTLAVNNGGEGGENDDVAADVEGAITGAGQDRLTSDEQGNTFDGGGGTDTAAFDGIAQGVDANLTSGVATGQGTDSLSNLENLLGSTSGDTLTGDAGINGLSGDQGDDTLDGRGGADGLNGWFGTDTATYANGPGGVQVDMVTDTATGAQGDDSLSDTIENITGSPGDDTILDEGDAEQNVFNGGDGVDTVSYEVSTGAVTADLAADTVSVGNDQIPAVENLDGSPQADVLTGDGGPNRLRGLASGDTITGAAGADDVFGGDGADSLLVRDGVADTFDCGPADNVADSVQADAPAGTDTGSNCETEDVIDLGVPPVQNPPVVNPPVVNPPVTDPPVTKPPTAKRCKKGQKRRVVKGKVRCVKKKRKKKK